MSYDQSRCTPLDRCILWYKYLYLCWTFVRLAVFYLFQERVTIPMKNCPLHENRPINRHAWSRSCCGWSIIKGTQLYRNSFPVELRFDNRSSKKTYRLCFINNATKRFLELQHIEIETGHSELLQSGSTAVGREVKPTPKSRYNCATKRDIWQSSIHTFKRDHS